MQWFEMRRQRKVDEENLWSVLCILAGGLLVWMFLFVQNGAQCEAITRDIVPDQPPADEWVPVWPEELRDETKGGKS